MMECSLDFFEVLVKRFYISFGCFITLVFSACLFLQFPQLETKFSKFLWIMKELWRVHCDRKYGIIFVTLLMALSVMYWCIIWILIYLIFQSKLCEHRHSRVHFSTLEQKLFTALKKIFRQEKAISGEMRNIFLHILVGILRILYLKTEVKVVVINQTFLGLRTGKIHCNSHSKCQILL